MLRPPSIPGATRTSLASTPLRKGLYVERDLCLRGSSVYTIHTARLPNGQAGACPYPGAILLVGSCSRMTVNGTGSLSPGFFCSFHPHSTLTERASRSLPLPWGDPAGRVMLPHDRMWNGIFVSVVLLLIPSAPPACRTGKRELPTPGRSCWHGGPWPILRNHGSPRRRFRLCRARERTLWRKCSNVATWCKGVSAGDILKPCLLPALCRSYHRCVVRARVSGP